MRSFETESMCFAAFMERTCFLLGLFLAQPFGSSLLCATGRRRIWRNQATVVAALLAPPSRVWGQRLEREPS